MSRSIDIHLLGSLELHVDGQPISVGGRAQRALLARLLLDANRTVSVDRLVDDLWGERAPASAPKMVQIYVSMLRKALPAGMLVTRSPGYAIEVAPESIDLVRFERLRERGLTALTAGSPDEASDLLRQALSLWRGAALAEFQEPFAEIEARRLEEQHLSGLEDRIDADLAVGRDSSLIGELEALVARHPLRERTRGQLMVALYRAGRQADALAGYRAFRQMLSEELGIDPGPALRELERRILQQDPDLNAPRCSRTARPHTARSGAVRQGTVTWAKSVPQLPIRRLRIAA